MISSRFITITGQVLRTAFQNRSLCSRKILFNNTRNDIRFFATKSDKSNSGRKDTSSLKLILFSAGLGALTGTVYSIYTASFGHGVTDHMIHEKKVPRILEKLPSNIKICKRYVNPRDTSGLDLVLFQFQTCPFCCKVRTFLDYMGLSYSVVEVDSVLKQDLKWSDYKKVPIVLARRLNGSYVQLTDSSTIISTLASYLEDPNQDIAEVSKLYPNVSFFDDKGNKAEDVMNKYFLMFHDRIPQNLTQKDMIEERQWRGWVDTHLVHLIAPNVYRTRQEAFETFEWFSEAGEWDEVFPKWEKDMIVYVGANIMWVISRMLKRKYSLSDDVRSHMYDALNEWTTTLEKRRTKFLGGKNPNLADLSVFGVLSSMEGCKTFKDCLENTKIGEWYYQVKEHVNKNRGHLERIYQTTKTEGKERKAEIA